MNCLEFRRLLGSDPLATAPGFARHRAECARCAEAAARALEFEATLRRALQVEPAAGFADSILLAQATRQNRQRTRARRDGLLALAAMLMLALGVGMQIEARPLSTLAVKHLSHEALALTSTTPVPPESVRKAFAQFGIALRDVPVAKITFVACCPVGRSKSVHLVMGGGDPVTVLYVVDRASAQREDFQREGWRGRSVPLGQGTLVLLARDSDRFDAVEALWRSALHG
jgi:hypothetical protein